MDACHMRTTGSTVLSIQLHLTSYPEHILQGFSSQVIKHASTIFLRLTFGASVQRCKPCHEP